MAKADFIIVLTPRLSAGLIEITTMVSLDTLNIL